MTKSFADFVYLNIDNRKIVSISTVLTFKDLIMIEKEVGRVIYIEEDS